MVERVQGISELSRGSASALSPSSVRVLEEGADMAGEPPTLPVIVLRKPEAKELVEPAEVAEAVEVPHPEVHESEAAKGPIVPLSHLGSEVPPICHGTTRPKLGPQVASLSSVPLSFVAEHFHILWYASNNPLFSLMMDLPGYPPSFFCL
ncbi:hypothetical protein Nepgr_030631 [Nepenthes gracilis]|uniref:Uncharacterized protein n=1 Tax=Nepenthes gracilis TaxID=150966 RepID=A0AAD3TF58_NEPGR|nr:hypothetical protein Nepgr_030631 [Nepenthes gracilis]